MEKPRSVDKYGMIEIFYEKFFSPAEEIYEVSRALLTQKWDGTTPVRLIGCGLGNVQKGTAGAQGDLFNDRDDRRRRVEQAAFKLRMEGMDIGRARVLRGRKHDDQS